MTLRGSLITYTVYSSRTNCLSACLQNKLVSFTATMSPQHYQNCGQIHDMQKKKKESMCHTNGSHDRMFMTCLLNCAEFVLVGLEVSGHWDCVNYFYIWLEIIYIIQLFVALSHLCHLGVCLSAVLFFWASIYAYVSCAIVFSGFFWTPFDSNLFYSRWFQHHATTPRAEIKRLNNVLMNILHVCVRAWFHNKYD